MRASESDRVVTCPASAFLEKVERLRSESSQKAVDWGTLVHFWKETSDPMMPGAKTADLVCLEKKLFITGVTSEQWWSGGEHEVSFSINLFNYGVVRYAGPRAGADDWKKQWDPKKYLTGTIDYLRPDRLDDLKTGRWPVDPKTSKQLRSYAALPWIEAGHPDDWEYLVSITTWQRYPLDGLPHRDYAWVTGAEMKLHMADLRYSALHPDETNPTDEGCKWCDCRPNCPDWAHERI